MKLTVCLFAGLDARTLSAAQEAARCAFPHARQMVFPDFSSVLSSPLKGSGELLVLGSVDAQTLSQAVETTDATSLRRWAITALAPVAPHEGVEGVPAEDWNAPVLERAFRSAVAQHHLIRQCQRYQGDLRTIAYRISHDLRSPLSSLVSSGDTLKEIFEEQDPANLVFAQTISESVDDLARLIERVSLLTKASAGGTAPKLIAMGDVVWAALQRNHRQITGKGAEVEQPETWPEVEGVATWLQAIWENLIANALQHGPETPRLKLGWTQEDAELCFWIVDNGGGVPEERLADLFQPFHLLHRTNARKGLGLSIVQRLLELQGGTCHYKRLPRGGSHFYFTLPAPHPNAPDSSRAGAGAGPS